MRVLETICQFRQARMEISGSLGFVPTMGYLHQGHMALVHQARTDNEAVAISIFVNPPQFGPSGDYQTYPRDLKRDLALLDGEGVDLVFVPSANEIYSPSHNTWVEVGGLTRRLEGESRPCHFKGVATVVVKLFNIVRPHRAYFGEKDAHQVLVIRRLVADLNMDLELVTLLTVREPDGLAISSRNVYLSPQERKAAAVLWKALTAACELWKSGKREGEVLRKAMADLINQEPLAKLDYVSVADTETLEELATIDRPALMSLAAWIGNTRLIDNIRLGEDASGPGAGQRISSNRVPPF